LQFLRIETQGGATFTGKAKRVEGPQAQIEVRGSVHISGKVLSVTTVGKGALTSAEASREDVVLKALQGCISLADHPFFCSTWGLPLTISWPPPVEKISVQPPVKCEDIQLNDSQDLAVKGILSGADEDRVMLIQGPPGTGKTTVIAASVLRMVKCSTTRTVWLVAQSNVAVKNIAEKLDKVEFHEFKLLVSKDFHFYWYVVHCMLFASHHTDSPHVRHEHLYKRLEEKDCVIRSDLFDDDPVGIDRRLLNTRVILCTLSMLSNSRIGDFTRLVPVQTIIFDEASQIEVGNYLPVLHRFRHSLQKMVFIGDDKQCEI
jgi:hypothetical protein